MLKICAKIPNRSGKIGKKFHGLAYFLTGPVLLRHIARRLIISGATLHQKLVVSGVGDIWRVRGVRAYNGGLKGFGKAMSKSVHKFSTFSTYMQGLVSYFADKNKCDLFVGGSPKR